MVRFVHLNSMRTTNSENRLAPHESPKTDVVLLGHSMGGLLAAEILLLPPFSPATGQAFRHRILGVINFDVPFLGMHPGVISSGIASIFASAPDPPGGGKPAENESGLTSPSTSTVNSQSTTQSSGRPSRQNTLFNAPLDPNYNPAFSNDVILPVRKGWRNALHFVDKHSGSLREATKQYVKSHIEFGGAMADYPGLKARYGRIRALEDEDDGIRKRAAQTPRAPPRIRFINYYTASTGRPKKPKSKSRSRSRSQERARSRPHSPSTAGTEMKSMAVPGSSAASRQSRSPSRSPRISIEEHRDDGVHLMAHIDPVAEPSDQEDEATSPGAEHSEASNDSDSDEPTILSKSGTDQSLTESSVNDILPPHYHVQLPNLPPIPPPPTEPPALDLTPYPDKAAQKIVQKEHDRKIKTYKQAMKDRDSALKDRAKLEAKMRKTAAKEILKQRKEEEKKAEKEAEKKKEEKKKGKAKESEPATPISPDSASTVQKSFTEAARGNTILSPPPSARVDLEQTQTRDSLTTTNSLTTTTTTDSTTSEQRKPEKKKKDRVFCMLPPKNANHERDPTWVRMYMEGVDEVGAHCGLFFVSETYERLVGDVSGRIEEWVREDMTRRFLEGQQ